MSKQEPQPQEPIETDDSTDTTNESGTDTGSGSPGEPELDDYYWELESFVGMITDDIVDSLMIVAKPGIGKSYTINEALKASSKEYTKVSGYCSPLALYNKMYEVHDGGVLFLDDVSGVPKDERSIELLKAATWTEDDDAGRVVSWESTTDKREAPPSYKFTGSLIMVFNELPDTEMTRSLVDRALVYNLAFTYAERLHIMREVAKTPYEDLSYEDRIEVVDYIEANTGPGDEVNMRTMFNIFDIRRANDERWKELADSQIDPDQELQIVRQLLDDHESVGDACAEFQNTTGNSRATFYRRKKEVMNDVDDELTASEAM